MPEDNKAMPHCMVGDLERIGQHNPDEEDFLVRIWEDGDDRALVLGTIEAGVEVRAKGLLVPDPRKCRDRRQGNDGFRATKPQREEV